MFSSSCREYFGQLDASLDITGLPLIYLFWEGRFMFRHLYSDVYMVAKATSLYYT